MSNRAQRRRQERKYDAESKKIRSVTYYAIKNDLIDMVREAGKEELQRAKEEGYDKAVNQSMILLLGLPLKVLMDCYWPKTYKKRLPGFTEKLLEYYSKWENDEITSEELQNELWDKAGIRIEEES